MTNQTRTKITIQTCRTTVVWVWGDSYHTWCERCLATVVALKPEFLIGLLEIQSDRFSASLATGELHTVATSDESPLICCNSLAGQPTETQFMIEGEEK